MHCVMCQGIIIKQDNVCLFANVLDLESDFLSVLLILVRQPILLWWLTLLHGIVHQTHFCRLYTSASHCYATKMYYALRTFCLLICNLDCGWINSCMDSLLWGDEREKSFLTCWLDGFFFFFFEMESKIELSCYWTKGKFVLSHERRPRSLLFFFFVFFTVS